jgi:hypothetical protein
MWSGLWVIAPVLGAYVAHAPVLRFDLLRPLDRPLDAGATVRGRRVFGDNKTWQLTLAPLWPMTPTQALVVFTVAVVVHLAINVLGHAIGARKTWI